MSKPAAPPPSVSQHPSVPLPSVPPDRSALDINCEAAVSHVAQYMHSEECPPGIELPDFSSLSNFAFLDKLSELLLVPSLTECVCIAFFPILPDLIGRWRGLGDEFIEKVACALARLIHIEPKFKRYLPLYLRTNLGIDILKNYSWIVHRF
jgi:hypothetical protein